MYMVCQRLVVLKIDVIGCFTAKRKDVESNGGRDNDFQ